MGEELHEHADMVWNALVGLCTIIAIGVSWFLRVLYKDLQRMRSTLNEFKLKVAEDYVKEYDFKEAVGALKEEFHSSLKPLCDRVTKLDDFLRGLPPSRRPTT